MLAATVTRPLQGSQAALVVLMVGYAVLYALLGWWRFVTFHAQIDMSYYVRLVWGLGHGHYDLPLVGARNVLGLHLEPVLLPFAFASRLGAPLVPLLLGVQAAAAACLAWPAFRLARRHLGGPRHDGATAALFVALAALLFPTVTVATLHDFHPVTLALAPLLGVLDALDEGRQPRALWLGGVALLCREDIALQLAAMLCVHPRTRGRYIPWLASLLVAYFLVYVFVVQPAFAPASSRGSYALHFGNLAQGSRSSRDVVAALVAHPAALLRYLVSDGRWAYPWVLLWPVALLPLWAPRLLAGALPIVVINVLSNFPRVRTIEAHYTTAIVPFVLGAAIVGAGRLRRRLAGRPRLAHLPLAALLVCVVVAHIGHGGSPLALRSARFTWSSFRDRARAAAYRRMLATVPPSASVAADAELLAHLAERPRILCPVIHDDGHPVDLTLRL